MNPMIRKELKQRMRDRRAWLVPTLYLAALGGAVALGYYLQTNDLFGLGELKELQGAEIGLSVFLTVAFTQMALLLLLTPVFSAGALTIEKEQRTMGGLLTSLLTPAQIWWGKFVSSMLYLLLLLVSALPVLSLAFALGGVAPLDVLKAAGITLLVLASMSTVGLYCSSYFRRSVHATAASYGVVIALTVVTFVTFTILTSRWAAGMQARGGRQEIPDYIPATMYMNPFFPLYALIGSEKERFPLWGISLMLFVALGCLATAFALRNIERSGEQL
jgi:ABC-type transport system involved in multi-copper enzyme maturation permease subunit